MKTNTFSNLTSVIFAAYLIALIILISLSARADVQVCITLTDDEAAYLLTRTNDVNPTIEAIIEGNSKRSAANAKRESNAKVVELLNAAPTKAKADAAKVAVDNELKKGE